MSWTSETGGSAYSLEDEINASLEAIRQGYIFRSSVFPNYDSKEQFRDEFIEEASERIDEFDEIFENYRTGNPALQSELLEQTFGFGDINEAFDEDRIQVEEHRDGYRVKVE